MTTVYNNYNSLYIYILNVNLFSDFINLKPYIKNVDNYSIYYCILNKEKSKENLINS